MLKDFKEVSNGFGNLKTVRAIRRIWVKNYSIDLIENLINFYRAVELERGTTDKVAEKAFEKLFEIRKIRHIKKYHKTIPKMFLDEIEINEEIQPLKVGVIGEIHPEVLERFGFFKIDGK